MKFNLSKVQYSRNDLKMGVIIPTKLSPELAELIGIVVGDGHVAFRRSSNRKPRYVTNISGNIKDSEHMDHINSLFHKIFGLNLNKHIIVKKNALILQKKSKALCIFFKEIIGIPNNKREIAIPKCILKSSPQMKALFLRGLADTDFCLTIKYKPNPYPVIQGISKSNLLIDQCSQIFSELGIKNNTRQYNNYYAKRDKIYSGSRLNICGYKMTGVFMQLVGFSNKNKESKYYEAISKRNMDTIKHTPKRFL
jgi:intein/homing endonuclease